MTWIDPKLDWKSSDYFYLTDWQRIVNNAAYLHDLVGATPPLKDCTLADESSLPYYDIVNNLEGNLKTVSDAYPEAPFQFEPTTWYPITSDSYTHNPSYEDFNRWETFESKLLNEVFRDRKQINVLRAGNFTAGNDRLRQYFGRGNI